MLNVKISYIFGFSTFTS